MATLIRTFTHRRTAAAVLQKLGVPEGKFAHFAVRQPNEDYQVRLPIDLSGPVEVEKTNPRLSRPAVYAKTAPKPQADAIKPCVDESYNSCLEVGRTPSGVSYIQVDVTTGLEVRHLPTTVFDQRFTPVADYPSKTACQLFAEYARVIGATPDALSYLKVLVNITDEEHEMAVSKKQAQAATAAVKETKAKVTEPKVVPTKAKAAAPVAAAGTKEWVDTGKPATAAAMIRKLIMKGTMTDDAIFAKVQEKFELSDDKRSYIGWYRSSLKRAGYQVPERKKPRGG